VLLCLHLADTCVCTGLALACCSSYILLFMYGVYKLELSVCVLQLADDGHYDADGIRRRRDDVLERWRKLKEALLANRERLGEAQSLQQFSRDADEMEIWITEKLQTATDESYKDPSNIQVSICFVNCLGQR